MKRLASLDFLGATLWTGWRRGVVFAVCIAVILLLGSIRTATDAELTFASLVLLPVLLIAWLGGTLSGLLMAVLAATMWLVADIYSAREFSSIWIPWINALVRFLTYCLVVLLVCKVKSQFVKERELATHDALTGLLNRRGFMSRGQLEVKRSKRYPSHFTVIFMDLDNFKALNDGMGHSFGDAALRATGRAIQAATRTSDLVARIGGDEFAIAMPEIDFDSAHIAAHKLFNTVNCAMDAYPPTRASVGVAWFQEPGIPFSDMLKCADELMYNVKAGGKNNILISRFAGS